LERFQIDPNEGRIASDEEMQAYLIEWLEIDRLRKEKIREEERILFE
jgi:hypothetical protein